MALLLTTLQVCLCTTVTAQLYARPRKSVSLHHNSFSCVAFPSPITDVQCRSVAGLRIALPFHCCAVLSALRDSVAHLVQAFLFRCAAFAKQCPPLPRFTVSTLFYSMRGISFSMQIRSSPHLALATLRRTKHFRRLAQSNLAIPSLNFFPRKTPLTGTAPLPEA